MILLFLLNSALNIGWSGLYFTLRRPDWALIEVVFLWASVAGMAWRLRTVSRRAAWLLLPYLLWVSIAAALNLETVRLNGPFA